MKRLHFQKNINAPASRVYHQMTDAEAYPIWTRPFCEGCYFLGKWATGEVIHFLMDDEQGVPQGLYSQIDECLPNQKISIKHLGKIHNGLVDLDSDEVKMWSPSFEIYQFTEQNGQTVLDIYMDSNEDHEAFFNNTWPKALDILAEISETALA